VERISDLFWLIMSGITEIFVVGVMLGGFILRRCVNGLGCLVVKITEIRLFKLLFHTLGMSCLGGAVFIEALVFSDILQHGYFCAVETEPFILTLELLLTIYAAIYLAYMFYRLMKRLESKPLISTTKTTTKIMKHCDFVILRFPNDASDCSSQSRLVSSITPLC